MAGLMMRKTVSACVISAFAAINPSRGVTVRIVIVCAGMKNVETALSAKRIA